MPLLDGNPDEIDTNVLVLAVKGDLDARKTEELNWMLLLLLKIAALLEVEKEIKLLEIAVPEELAESEVLRMAALLVVASAVDDIMLANDGGNELGDNKLALDITIDEYCKLLKACVLDELEIIK